VDEFFLIGMVVEAVPLAGQEGSFQHGELAGSAR
jgi:hypothetical protein